MSTAHPITPRPLPSSSSSTLSPQKELLAQQIRALQEQLHRTQAESQTALQVQRNLLTEEARASMIGQLGTFENVAQQVREDAQRTTFEHVTAAETNTAQRIEHQQTQFSEQAHAAVTTEEAYMLYALDIANTEQQTCVALRQELAQMQSLAESQNLNAQSAIT